MNARLWIQAARPKTLPASVAPMLVASALAWRAGSFEPMTALLSLLCALFLQVGANYCNDYFDGKRGADGKGRVGPMRAVASGWLEPEKMLRAVYGAFAVACCFAVWVIGLSGAWWLLLVLPLGVWVAYAYTGGPFPLAYRGLGDLAVLISFGPVGVGLGYYVQSNHLDASAFLLGMGTGCFAAGVLAVNNYRDANSDKAVGKKTLAVRFGREFCFWEYVACLGFAFALLFGFFLSGWGWGVLLPWLLLMRSARICMRLKNAEPELSNALLGETACLMMVYAALLGIGLQF